ncbi:MAG: DMT family transporter [Chitinophagales bacterium]|nr:DMT family transporter [Chitinophagales bacterium]
MNLRIFYHPVFQIHLAVFLWGFTAILGKLISMDTLRLVFIRMFLAAFGFLILPMTRVHLKKLTRYQFIKLIGIGAIICLHWLCFYQSIKEYNSSSIALVCLGISPMFVIWLEYVARISKTISLQKILISVIAIVGMCFIANGNKIQEFSLDTPSRYEWAIFYGVLSSLLASVFTIMNGKMSNDTEPGVLSFIEMLSGGLCLFLYIFFFSSFGFLQKIPSSDVFYILILSFICTNVPFLLSIYALKKLEPFIITLTVNLEPIYGLIFAAILFQEHEGFNLQFYTGVILILFSVFLPLLIAKWKKVKK